MEGSTVEVWTEEIVGFNGGGWCGRRNGEEKWRRDERVGFSDIWGQNRPKSIYPNASHACNACVSHLALKWTEMGK